MKVVVKYLAQVRQAAGMGGEDVEVPSPCSAEELVVRLAGDRGGSLGRILLDGGGRLQPTILLFVGDSQVSRAAPAKLRDGDVVTVLSPMSGG